MAIMTRVGLGGPLGVRNADPAKDTYGRPGGFRSGHIPMEHEGLGDLVAGREDGIKAGHRFLEYHRDPVAP
jgi:hypothetical protein